MRYLTIRGEQKQIPPYPHHKDYVYRCRYFFEAETFSRLVLINGLYKALRQYMRKLRFGFPIPYNLLIDPTNACNLKCTGCWAADYSKTHHLSFEKLDEILTDARKLGVSDIVMSGGEPMMRKTDILRLCEKHNRLPFSLYTNGTLIDEAFADEMVRLGNLNVFLSLEGFREQTDLRRGAGTYDRIMAAMDLLRERDLGFAFSVTYHSGNYREICSDEFLDFMVRKGVWMGWFFNFMPIGKDADVALCCSPEQRAYVKEKIEHYRQRKGVILIDFANIGHQGMGCMAAGIGFAHINACGDLEPCAFNHYSDSNLHEKTLKEALASPFFKRFRQAMPFAGNVARPCPIMDHPEILMELTAPEGIRSTHPHHPETAEQLAKKTQPLAHAWKPVADDWQQKLSKREKRKTRLLTKFHVSK